jgi:hypothetical protein
MRVRGWARLMVPMLLALGLSACGGGGGGGSSPPVADPSGQASNPLEQALGDSALTISGLLEQGINSKITSVRLTLSSASFGSTPADLAVSINGSALPSDAIALAADNTQQGTAAVNLEDGFNDVLITGSDDSGRLLRVHKQIWAGANRMTVKVQDASGADWKGGADITVSLADAPGVSASYTLAADTSALLVRNLPSRTVLVEARSGALAGMAGAVVVSNGEIVVRLQPGATGSPPTSPISNQTLNTAGQVAPQWLSNTFVTASGTQAVTVRYHFKTAEVPAGQFGSRTSNDYYSVRLRNVQGQQAVESLAMNGLGEAAFDAVTGATASRTLRLATNPTGDTVRLDAVVGNTFDGKNDAQLVIEQITAEPTLIQPQLAWDTVQGGLAMAVSLQGAALASALPLKLYWASGPSPAQILGTPLATFDLPQGSVAGAPLSFRVEGSQLGDAPASATHLLAIVGDAPTSATAALADVQLVSGPNADAGSLSPAMRRLLKSAARQAGAATLSLAQTALTPAQFAHAMFLNMVRGTSSLADNIRAQLAIYGAEGDAVVQVFATQSQGLTRDQVMLKQKDIESAMAAEIVRQGPTLVSTQCADPAQASVADVRVASVPAATANLFKARATSLATALIETSGLWHITAAP